MGKWVMQILGFEQPMFDDTGGYSWICLRVTWNQKPHPSRSLWFPRFSNNPGGLPVIFKSTSTTNQWPVYIGIHTIHEAAYGISFPPGTPGTLRYTETQPASFMKDLISPGANWGRRVFVERASLSRYQENIRKNEQSDWRTLQ